MSLSYICTNASCPAPAEFKGKEFPAAMDCIFCSTPLTAKTSFTSEQEDLLNSLPYLVAYPLKRTLLESHAWTKINLFKDTFLNYLKYLGLLCASEFFGSDLRNKNMVSLFQQALAEPSFGTWNMYIRESLKFLEDNNHQFFLAELPEYYARVETGKKRKLYKGNIEYIDGHGEVQLKKQEATGIGMLINFRNRFLGHGQTLDENESKALWEEYSPIFFTLLKQMSFCKEYPMLKNEHGNTYKLQTPEIKEVEHEEPLPSKVWIENASGDKIDVVPFFVVPGELAIAKEDKEQLLTYESYTGKTIKFFSPEGSEKQTSGNILERLNLLLREKQSEETFSPSSFTKEVFERQIKEENKFLLNTLVAERKVIPGVYVHRKDIEVRLKEWVGARASILFITAEAGSGKTNLLVEAQRLYQEDGMHSVIIRAGRMEKVTLKEQLAYMLNLEPGRSLGDYEHIAGTQSAPTFVLLDGLNEASNAVSIWNEVLDVAGMFTSGSLKFVVTSRSNTNADIERYGLAESQEELLYRDSKSENTDLKSSAFWLTALNMEEMKEAWLMYGKKDKSRFKPLFSFDDIADVDRGIYDQINNPLILRIFLEIYSGKKLLSKGKKVLNIWEDWLRTFSQEEKAFMQLLASKVWEKGVNELLLDDLLQDKELKDYLVSDALNSPYQRLKNLGWISRFTKDLDIVLGFTVEGLLLHLLAKQLEEKGGIDVHFIDDILAEDSPIKKSTIEQYLSLEAAKGKISLVTTLIDAEGEYTSLCLKPLLNYIKVEGVEAMVNEVLADPTDGDWEALDELDNILEKLTLSKERNELAVETSSRNNYDSLVAIRFGLKMVALLDDSSAREYFESISVERVNEIDDAEVFDAYADVYLRFSNYDLALEYYQKGLEINIKVHGYTHPFVGKSFNSIGFLLWEQGNHNEALGYYQRSLKVRLRVHGDSHSDVGTSYNNIGVVFSEQSDNDKALEYYKKSLKIGLQVNGDAHPDVGMIYNNIGTVLSRQGNYDEALEYHQKSLNINLRVHGDSHSVVGISYNNMAAVLENQGNYKKALKYYRKSLKIWLQAYGDLAPKVGQVYNNIGHLLHNQGNYNQALEYFHKSLNIRIQLHGESHPSVGQVYNNIALLLYVQGKHDQALTYNQKSLNINLEVHGVFHPDVGTEYNNIGTVLKDQENYDQALEYYQKSLKIRIQVHGDSHPSVATSYNSIGTSYYKQGNYDEALEYYQKSLKIRLQVHGESHPDVGTSYNNIGVLLDDQGNYDEALEYYKRSLSIDIKVYGDIHAHVGTGYNNLGTFLYNQYRYNEAMVQFQKSLKIRQQLYGELHQDVGESYQNIGAVLEELGDHNEALEYYQKSLEVRLQVHGESHSSVAITNFNIGQSNIQLHRYEDAIKYLLDGYKFNKAGGFPYNIGTCYEALGQGENALKYYIESAEIRYNQLGVDDESTTEARDKAVEVAIKLDKMSDLPGWIFSND